MLKTNSGRHEQPQTLILLLNAVVNVEMMHELIARFPLMAKTELSNDELAHCGAAWGQCVSGSMAHSRA